MKLLLLCAGTRLDPGRLDRVRTLVGGDVAWERLLATAGRHGMTPLLFRHLDALGPGDVPPVVLDRLRTSFEANTRRNLFLAGELLQTIAAARARGLPVVAYKGPALALMAYGHLGLREFGDLDLLVRPDDVAEMAEVLETRGYVPEFRLNSARGPAYRLFESVLVFRRRDPDSTVELHWRLTPRYLSFPRDPDSVWRELVTVPLGGRPIPTLSLEATLLFLAVHGAKHHWENLGWVCDVACLLENAGPFDWDRVLSRSGEEHCRRILFVGLFLAQDLLGAALPTDLTDRMRDDPTAFRLANTIRERFHRFPDRPERPVDHGLFLFRCRERLRDRFRCGLELALRPNEGDLRSLPLPGPLTPLYYLIRPVRLAGRYGMTLFRRAGAGGPGGHPRRR